MTTDWVLSVEIDKKAFPATSGAGETVVLRDFRFTLARREILAIVGPSGCGKTTLLKMIGGLDADFTGRIAWSGAGRPRIGAVFQEPRLLPWRTVRQNIDLVLSAGADPAEADDLLKVLGLETVGDVYPAKLSVGMARRAAIARAFVIAPEIVLLDEPFVSLDPAMAERSRGVLLTAWSRRPTAALLVTHDLIEAASLADRILMLAGAPARVVADIPIPESSRRSGRAAAADLAAELHVIATDASTP